MSHRESDAPPDPEGVHAAYARALRERGFREDPSQRAAVDRLEDLRMRLIAAPGARGAPAARLLRRLTRSRRPGPERGLYLWGSVGRGKTWLMDLFFQSLPFEERSRSHFHRFMHDTHARLRALGGGQAPLETVAAQLSARTRVLCFDELFVTDIADAMILGGLFRGLFARGVTLVATSNVPPRDLYRGGLQRERFIPAIRLIERHTEVLAVDGNLDYRLRQLTHAPIYLATGDAATRRSLEALFVQLADGTGEPGATLEIDGRTLRTVRDSESVVWFEFAELCEGPRSQNDYIEIARDYQAVIVSGVPAFDAARDDAARRFMALVDEFYDRGVKLVLSAETAPQELYRGERLAFPFRRTVSRLMEMQSREYLAREHKS